MRHPLDEVIVTQAFGAHDVDYSQYGLIGHHGCDCRALTPKPVYAPEDATVFRSANGVNDQYTDRFASGEVIVLMGSHEHWLMHLSRRLVTVGMKVKEGQLIGHTGETGAAQGPHLHWGVRPLRPNLANGYRGFIDPERLMKEIAMYAGVDAKTWAERADKATQIATIRLGRLKSVGAKFSINDPDNTAGFNQLMANIDTEHKRIDELTRIVSSSDNAAAKLDAIKKLIGG